MTIEVKHATQAVGTDAGNGEIAKTQWNEAHTINMATGNLLGRSTAGAGAVEEIAIGSGLSLSAGTLSASGGGGGGALTISNKTAAYTVVAGDLGTIINCTSGTFTVSLTAAATLGAGFNCWIWNSGSGVITIDPSGSETIEGRATLPVYPGSGIQLVCTGINWSTMDGRAVAGIAWNMSVAAAPPFATGLYAIAIGGNSTASGQRSLAIGLGNIASSLASTAIGYNSGGFGSQAVTGSGAMALGGSYASGTDSFAAAVANNTSTYGALGGNGIAIGYRARAAAGTTNAIAIGANAVASGGSALAIALAGTGWGTQATASNAIAIGDGARSPLVGKYVLANGCSSTAAGDMQTGTTILAGYTTDATPYVMRSYTYSGADATNQVILPNNSAYAFSGIIVARQKASNGTASAAWKVEGLIRREGTAASTTLVASTVTAISNVPGWTLALSADTTNGGLAVTATGAAATNIRWVATIQTSEVTYA